VTQINYFKQNFYRRTWPRRRDCTYTSIQTNIILR